MFIGIDLGTSNSTLAVFDGDAVTVVPNALGENLTPSVVRMDGRGNVSVGRKAQRFLESDPGSVCAEFKRLMGTAEPRSFAGIAKSFLPEELSALVLGALLADARDALGFRPRAAVISTPALFELPQNHATVKAGKLAGLDEVVLIQEPIAAAIAAGWRQDREGTWLVFDLGGGTLDVSLLETTEGRLRVVDHAGDNFLGGKDLDQALVDWALLQIHGQFRVPALHRANPAAAPCLARLKAACEQTRVELSRTARASVVAPGLCDDAATGRRSSTTLPSAAAGWCGCWRCSRGWGSDRPSRRAGCGGPGCSRRSDVAPCERYGRRLRPGDRHPGLCQRRAEVRPPSTHAWPWMPARPTSRCWRVQAEVMPLRRARCWRWPGHGRNPWTSPAWPDSPRVLWSWMFAMPSARAKRCAPACSRSWSPLPPVVTVRSPRATATLACWASWPRGCANASVMRSRSRWGESAPRPSGRASVPWKRGSVGWSCGGLSTVWPSRTRARSSPCGAVVWRRRCGIGPARSSIATVPVRPGSRT